MKSMIVLILFILCANSQNPPCFNQFNGLTYEIVKPTDYPELSISMPYEVLYSYIALDSVVNNSSIIQVKDFLDRQTYNDTIKTIMKYFYSMINYNQLKYINYVHHNPSYYNSNPTDVEQEFFRTLERISPSPMMDRLIFDSEIIAHIKINNQFERTDNSAISNKSVVIAECEILEQIKGASIPCKNFYPLENMKLKDDISSSNCLQFEYRKETQRNKYAENDFIKKTLDTNGNAKYPKMTKDNGSPWTEINKEYIVFLEYLVVCSNSNNNYFTLTPNITASWTGTIYPIENGIVIYPNDEFNSIGNNLDVQNFKNLFISRINEISNY